MNQESGKYHVRRTSGIGIVVTHKATGNTKIVSTWYCDDSVSEHQFNAYCDSLFKKG